MQSEPLCIFAQIASISSICISSGSFSSIILSPAPICGVYSQAVEPCIDKIFDRFSLFLCPVFVPFLFRDRLMELFTVE